MRSTLAGDLGRPAQDNPGVMEQEVLEMVQRTAPPGNAQAVLDAMDEFSRTGKGLLINIGDTKSVLVEAVIAERQPKVITCCICKACI